LVATADRPLLVPSFIAGESCYMIGKLGGAKAEAAFLRLLESGWFGSSISPRRIFRESRSSSSGTTIFPWAPPMPQ